jgi:hypothetical protein
MKLGKTWAHAYLDILKVMAIYQIFLLAISIAGPSVIDYLFCALLVFGESVGTFPESQRTPIMYTKSRWRQATFPHHSQEMRSYYSRVWTSSEAHVSRTDYLLVKRHIRRQFRGGNPAPNKIIIRKVYFPILLRAHLVTRGGRLP